MTRAERMEKEKIALSVKIDVVTMLERQMHDLNYVWDEEAQEYQYKDGQFADDVDRQRYEIYERICDHIANMK